VLPHAGGPIRECFWTRKRSPIQGRSHVSKIGVSIFTSCPTDVQLQRSKALRGEEWGGGVPLSSRLEGLGERRQLPQPGLGQSPGHRRFWDVSCAILSDFTHLSVHLTVGLLFPFNFLECRTPQLEFWGCVRTPTIPTVAAPMPQLLLTLFLLLLLFLFGLLLSGFQIPKTFPFLSQS